MMITLFGVYADGGFEKGKWDGKEELGRKGITGLRERTVFIPGFAFHLKHHSEFGE